MDSVKKYKSSASPGTRGNKATGHTGDLLDCGMYYILSFGSKDHPLETHNTEDRDYVLHIPRGTGAGSPASHISLSFPSFKSIWRMF